MIDTTEIISSACYSEFEINVAGKRHRVFLQPGFFPSVPLSCRFHRHSYAEAHIALRGETAFRLDKETRRLRAGDILILPPKTYHGRAFAAPGTLTSSFLIDLELTAPIAFTLPPALLEAFFAELTDARETQNFVRIPHYLSLLFTHATNEFAFTPGVKDYYVVIQDFFNVHYDQDVHLSDLTEILHLSTRQTERLIKEYTGHSFRSELVNIRLLAAKHLLDTTSLNLKEICQSVGFKSYSGFWKAMKARGYIDLPDVGIDHKN